MLALINNFFNFMKKILIIPVLLIILSLSACNATQDNLTKNNDNQNTTTEETKDVVKVDNSRDNVIKNFIGKPTLIILASTTCPHCKAAMPKFKTEVWDKYKDSTNIFVNVLNDSKFDVEEITQGFDKNLNFKILTGKDCGYVPSWVILDRKGEVAQESCGGSKDITDIISTFDNLLAK